MKKRFKKLSYTIYECKYHIIICAKYRNKIFRGEIAEYARQQIYSLCQQKELVEILELNVRPENIHLVQSIPPQYAVSLIMGYVKGKRYWRRHLWARGYRASTVGLNEEMIRTYVQWEEKKEKDIEKQQLNIF